MRFLRLLLIPILSIAVIGCTKESSDRSSNESTDGPRSFCENQSRITNGEVCSNPGSSSVVMLALADRSGELKSLCSGSLLTPTHVLTAAHCLDRSAGIRNIFVDETGDFDFVEAASWEAHPDWFGAPGNPHDVGVVTLSRPLNNRATAPLLLSREIRGGDTVEIYGYGLDENESAGVLKQGRMKVDSIDRLGNLLANYDDTEMNICSGDSGGPLAAIGESGIGTIGVNSAGSAFGCLEGSQALFVSVQSGSNLDFITNNVPQVRVR